MNVSWRAVFTVAATGLALVPATGRAGTYDVWSCRGPEGSPLATSAWTPSGQVADTCAQPNGALRVTPDGSVRLAAPDGTRIAGYQLWRASNDDQIFDDV